MKTPRFPAGALSLLFVAATFPVAKAQSFTHPGISHSQADLDRMKNNVNVEPYKTAYAWFSSQGYSQSSNHGQGAVTSEVNGGAGQFSIRNDAQVTHWNAVMWYVTGNTAYRDNAINIMMNWANTLTSFDVSDHITAGTCLYDFCNAAEIIRATGGGAWSAADITTFQNWLVKYLYPPLLTPGKSIAANQLEAAGHGGLQIKGLIAMGIFCDRQDIYNFGISSYQHNGTYSYGLLEYIDSASFQNYETQRDQGHAAGNLSTFTESAYMAWNQGLDLFGNTSNLLSKACEVQAKIDQQYNVYPTNWTSLDGTYHNSISGDARQPFDNLESDIAYNIYHNVKGLNIPYTKMSSDLKFPQGTSIGPSFFFRVDNTGSVPLAPFYGEPAATDVALFSDHYYSGYYQVHFQPGSYTRAALNASGVTGGPWGNGSNTVRSIQVPAGWTVTAYNADNFTGSSVVLTASQQNLGAINWDSNIVSLVISGGGNYTVSNGIYKIVNRNSGKVADVYGASTADGGSVVQWPYASASNQLWRVENTGNGQYRFLNLNSNKAMEVSGASLTNGAAVDQRTYVPPPNLATGGAASASSGNTGGGEGAAQAFDGNTGTKWNSGNSSPTGWLQYQFGGGQTYAVNQYRLTSANDVPQRDPAAWQFQGSNNGSTWTTLDTQTAQVFSNRAQTNTYSFTNATAYAYYRLNITANNGGSAYNLQLAELTLHSSSTGGVNQRWTFLPNPGSTYGTYMEVQNVNSGQVLDVSGASTSNGAGLVQQPQAYPSGGADQQWLLQVP